MAEPTPERYAEMARAIEEAMEADECGENDDAEYFRIRPPRERLVFTVDPPASVDWAEIDRLGRFDG